MATEIAYAKEKYDAIERLHANSRARGMSEAAIAKLPKLPVYVKPIVVPPPVMATARNAGFDMAASRVARDSAWKRFQKRGPGHLRRQEIKALPFEHTTHTIHTPPSIAEMARAKAITAIVATAAKLEPYQIGGKDRSRRLTTIRHLAIKIVAELMHFSTPRLTKIFGFKNDSACRYAIQKAQWLLSLGDERVCQVYAESLTAIRQRWPEYAA